jgi:long-subunit fatty acid transport protein
VASTFTGLVLSQNETDALRFSQSFFGGSARSMGMAGSFSALGADVGAMTTNPAGLARFSGSLFSLTTGPQNTVYKSSYNGTSSSNLRIGVPIQGFALVINKPKMNEFGWKSIQTTFAYNRLASFNASKLYEGINYQSLLDVFAAQGYGTSTSDLRADLGFTTNLAWQTYAIDNFVNSLGQTEYLPRLSGGDSMYHKRTVNSNGGISEYSFALSGNYNNSLYVGGSLNIQRVSYFEEMSHKETVQNPGSFSLRSFDYDFNLKSRGIGANIKLGILWLPTDEFRLGIAVHTPTAMRFNETYDADMTAIHDFGPVDLPAIEIPSGQFKYRFRNPARLTSSIAYVFEKRLAMNLDLEFVNYGKSAFQSSSNSLYQYNYMSENAFISDFYRNVINTRIGLEYALTPFWFIRSGYAIYPRAIDNRHKNAAEANHFLAMGAGYRKGSFSIDLAYLHHSATSEYYGFNPEDSVNKVVFSQSRHSLIVTLAFRFD